MSGIPIANVPCARGKALGEQIARLTPVVPEMCASCAFRAGTFPNQCLETVLGAVECVIDGKTFYCHVKTTPGGREMVCAGFLSAITKEDWGARLNLPS